MFKGLPENVRQIITSTLPLVVVIILFVIVGQFGFTKISEVRNEISKGQKDQAVLTQKLDLLNTISSTLSTSVVPTSNALPGANPALTVLSQVKSMAGSSAILIANVKGGAEVKDNSGLSRVDISFDALGERSQILNFLKGISKIAPITLVDKVKITESAGQARATISIRSFFAAFPTKLPALTEAITDLTADEKKTLLSVVDLTQPQFIEVPPSEGSSRPDPFTQ